MLVTLDDNHRIKSDEYQWIVQKKEIAGEKSKNPGEVSWENLTYHTSLESAVKSARQRSIRMTDGDGVADLLKAVENYDTALSDALKGV